tara:strand:+ start:133 stop:507 length:375 start_codon:yes stop_codon:yes gene_type:complete
MKITRTSHGDTLDLSKLTVWNEIDILSVSWDKNGDSVLLKLYNWQFGLKYSVANTRLWEDDYQESWEITLEPYNEDVEVISGLTADEVIQMVRNGALQEFFEHEPKSYTEPVDDDYKAYLADND